ncbi:MAG: hypothetical protein HN576_12395 [Bacteriovoracaceae bacterium]|jgi:hypothetical protein|nr:hypothetical protein [Bacteriovoracaceae bacterium]
MFALLSAVGVSLFLLLPNPHTQKKGAVNPYSLPISQKFNEQSIKNQSSSSVKKVHSSKVISDHYCLDLQNNNLKSKAKCGDLLEKILNKDTYFLTVDYCNQKFKEVKSKSNCLEIQKQNQRALQIAIIRNSNFIENSRTVILTKTLVAELKSEILAKNILSIIERLHPESEKLMKMAVIDHIFNKIKDGYRPNDINASVSFFKDQEVLNDIQDEYNRYIKQ